MGNQVNESKNEFQSSYSASLDAVYKIQAASKAIHGIVLDGDMPFDDKYALDSGDVVTLSGMLIDLSHELYDLIESMNSNGTWKGDAKNGN